MSITSRYVVLAILDGWGIAQESPGNSISKANTQNMDKFIERFPHGTLTASGQAVGLPRREDGNTETGHLNLGAGRIIFQDLERLNMAIAEGSFFSNEYFLGAIEHARKYNSKLHIMGLIGAAGVHSNLQHLYALLQIANRENFRNVYLHLFTDGRDSPPMAAKIYIAQLNKVIKKENVGTIASVIGRYWAMDRDERWDRTQKAYLALTKGEGKKSESIDKAIDASYNKGKTDEFIEPVLITKNGKPLALVEENDSVIFFNFRIDRPRQLTKAFVFDDFTKASILHDFDPHRVMYEKRHTLVKNKSAPEPFNRGMKINNLYFCTMTEYGKPITEAGAHPAFPPKPVKLPLGEVVANAGLKQLRLTESEKERFVTYYFNGLEEDPFEGENRIIVPSPSVATYDLRPEMSTHTVTQTLLSELKKAIYSLYIVNFPNADMVGHTGNIGPAVRAIEAVDESLGRITDYTLFTGGTLIITADHGNAEEMINPSTGAIDTKHSDNPVPIIVVNKDLEGNNSLLPDGILADVAPTILSILGIKIPPEMTGQNLVEQVWK